MRTPVIMGYTSFNPVGYQGPGEQRNAPGLNYFSAGSREESDGPTVPDPCRSPADQISGSRSCESFDTAPMRSNSIITGRRPGSVRAAKVSLRLKPVAPE